MDGRDPATQEILSLMCQAFSLQVECRALCSESLEGLAVKAQEGPRQAMSGSSCLMTVHTAYRNPNTHLQRVQQRIHVYR